jgi:hypothetical protein
MVSNDGFCISGVELSVSAIIKYLVVRFYIKFIQNEINFAYKLSIV